MSVACVSWLPVTSLPPMSTNQMWLAWLTGLSSSHWQLTLLCVHQDVGKMPPESCLSSLGLCSFNLLFTFCIAYFAAPLCPSGCSHFSLNFFFSFLHSNNIMVNPLSNHSPVISDVMCLISGPSVSFYNYHLSFCVSNTIWSIFSSYKFKIYLKPQQYYLLIQQPIVSFKYG